MPRDLVDIFERNERQFFGGDPDAKQRRCSFCRGMFFTDDLTNVGEQVIRGKYVRNAHACIECEPTVADD